MGDQHTSFDTATARILVVDDDRVSMKTILYGLSNCGYQTVTPSFDPKEALELVQSNFYDVIFCDIVMPGVSGFDILSRVINTEYSCGHSPMLIMVSAEEEREAVEQSITKGADHYMVKPILKTQLSNLYSWVLKKRRDRKVEKSLQVERNERMKLDIIVHSLETTVTELNSKIGEAVDMPIQAITRTIQELQQQICLSPEIQTVLRDVLSSLASSDLYKPAFHKILSNETVDQATRKWLVNELGCFADLKEKFNESGLVHWSNDGVEEHIKQLRSFEYDALSKKPEELVSLLHCMFDDFNLLERFHVDNVKFKNFILAIQSQYIDTNPYHNFYHGFDVTQTTYSLLTVGEGASFFTHAEIFGLLIACLCHDVGHFGLNNQYLIKTRHELSTRYNDQSVLENFHCSKCFTVLQDPECNILEGLSEEQYVAVRKVIVHCILATDLSKHMEIYSKLENMHEAFDKKEHDHRLLVAQLFIKCADISNPAKPFRFAHQWAVRVQEEFFAQGDHERNENREISSFMDRNAPDLAKLQIGFAEFFVIPSFTLLQKLMEKTSPFLTNLLDNRQKWNEIKEASAPSS